MGYEIELRGETGDQSLPSFSLALSLSVCLSLSLSLPPSIPFTLSLHTHLHTHSLLPLLSLPLPDLCSGHIFPQIPHSICARPRESGQTKHRRQISGFNYEMGPVNHCAVITDSFQLILVRQRRAETDTLTACMMSGVFSAMCCTPGPPL